MSNWFKCVVFPHLLMLITSRRELNNLTARPASGYLDLLCSFQLVYREYVRRGYCNQRHDKLHFTLFNLLPSAQTFVLDGDDGIAGTISVFHDSQAGLPLESVFPDEIQRMRDEGKRLAEVGSLSLDSGHTKGFSLTSLGKMVPLFNLFRMAYGHMILSNVSHVVIAVHPKHEPLYRFLNFRPIAPVRSYDSLRGNKALLMVQDLHATFDLKLRCPVAQHYWGFFLPTLELEAQLERRYRWRAADLEILFTFSEISAQTRAMIESFYTANHERSLIKETIAVGANEAALYH